MNEHKIGRIDDIPVGEGRAYAVNGAQVGSTGCATARYALWTRSTPTKAAHWPTGSPTQPSSSALCTATPTT
jgi:hypothetical protein